MNELQQEFVSQLARYGRDIIEPGAEEDDREFRFRNDVYTGLGDLGATGMVVPEEYGGAGTDYVTYCLALEEIAKWSVAYAITTSVSTMVQASINHFGTEDQKKKYLPPLTSGAEIGAYSLSESSSGSDAAALKTTAKKTDGGFVLNGSKLWVSSAGIAKTYLVMARTGDESAKGISAFIIRDGMKGFSYGKKESKIGWKARPTRELIFSNCFVPEENLLGELNKGFPIAMWALDKGRITVGAVSTGLAKRSLEVATNYALEREQFGRSLFEFQGLQFLMAEMATDLEAARLLVLKAAQCLDEGQYNQKLACMAKMRASDTAMRITTDSVQLLGGVGVTTEYPTERFMRDAKILQIVEGTNQIQKIVIARNLKNELASKRN